MCPATTGTKDVKSEEASFSWRKKTFAPGFVCKSGNTVSHTCQKFTTTAKKRICVSWDSALVSAALDSCDVFCTAKFVIHWFQVTAWLVCAIIWFSLFSHLFGVELSLQRCTQLKVRDKCQKLTLTDQVWLQIWCEGIEAVLSLLSVEWNRVKWSWINTCVLLEQSNKRLNLSEHHRWLNHEAVERETLGCFIHSSVLVRHWTWHLHLAIPLVTPECSDNPAWLRLKAVPLLDHPLWRRRVEAATPMG